MNTSIKTIGTRLAIVIAVGLVAGTAFLVRGEEPGTTFATYGIDLKIDSKAWYNGAFVPSATWSLKNLVPGVDKFYNFDDIKPGDFGCTVISLHVKKSDAWMCLDFKNFTQAENGVNEPESYEDGTPGADLADGTEFFGWLDDGDGTYEPPLEKPLFGTSTQSASTVLASTTYAIADSRGGNSCKIESKRYIGTCFCAGNLTVQPNGTFLCDATTLGNEAQTDSFAVDVSIRAVPEKQHKKFSCGGYPPVTPPCDKCGPLNVKINIKNSGTNVNVHTSSSASTGGNSGGGSVTTGDTESESSTSVEENTTSFGGPETNQLSTLVNRVRDRFR